MIVCRVSLGKILNYRFAPAYVHENTGYGGNHAVINNYAMEEGYTTGEWWNSIGYWEYCMFDWQNRYNHPWRIRPIYVFNFRTGLAQHIDGGFRHWLFSKSVLIEIANSARFTVLVVVAFAITIWCVVRLISTFNHWDPFTYIPPQQETYIENVVDEEENMGCCVDDETEVSVEKEEPQPVYSPPVKSSSAPKPSYTPKSTGYKQKKLNKTPTTHNPTKSKHGFRLEKVDKIPTADNTTNKKKGYRLEKVDRIPTKDNPTDKSNQTNLSNY